MSSVTIFIGEGNFSFSASVALSSTFPSLNTTIIATDFQPELRGILEEDGERDADKKELNKKRNFSTSALKENISCLKSLGHTVLLDTDATKIHEHKSILNFFKRRDCDSDSLKVFIVFNFPHVKCKKMKIGLNRDLLKGFFMSCDSLTHILNEFTSTNCKYEVVPIVSLCAGQSGIPEVDPVAREWGDSWQINDMAAHGNFVCVSICKFNDWDLYTMSKSTRSDDEESRGTYKSSCYRLQSGVSFTTENALTLTYQHREHVKPHETDRLQSIFFRKRLNRSSMCKNFLQQFSPILEEKIIFSKENAENDNSKSNDKVWRHYHHIAVVSNEKGECKDAILDYLSELEGLEVKAVEEKVYVQLSCNDGCEMVLVATVANDKMSLFVDKLLELKFNEDYRQVLSNAISPYAEKSLYPRIHEFHISFWLSSKFTFDSFMETLLDVYGLMLKAVELLEEYEKEPERKSLCWRIHIQSLDLALSRHCAHEIYLNLRQVLHERLDVEVR